jgi:hypothetical protein
MPIRVTGSYKHNSPLGQWSHGMPTTAYCGSKPESWIRGSASLDPSSGMLSMTIQLETDDTSAGPKGRVLAVLKDANGKTLAIVTSEEVGMGGKPPGPAMVRNFSSQVQIDPHIAVHVASIFLDAECTGKIDCLWNINMSTAQDMFKIAVAIAAVV